MLRGAQRGGVQCVGCECKNKSVRGQKCQIDR